MVHRGAAKHSPLRADVLAVLRAIRDGGKVDGEHAPTIQAVSEALRNDWLEVLNERAAVKKWRYKLTAEGKKQAGPVLRLLRGGR